MEKKLQVGQTVWIKEINVRVSSEMIQAKVIKVAKKYFWLDYMSHNRFVIDTLKHDAGQYMSRYRVYLDKQEYYDQLEVQRIYKHLNNFFTVVGNNPLDLETLRDILNKVEKHRGL